MVFASSFAVCDMYFCEYDIIIHNQNQSQTYECGWCLHHLFAVCDMYFCEYDIIIHNQNLSQTYECGWCLRHLLLCV